MTVSESIINWLKTFKPEEYQNMKSIQTDMHPATEYSYSLAKEPTQNVKSFISGKKIITGYYTIHARLPSQDNASRKENVAWGEALEKWIVEQNEKKQFPEIDGVKVNKISITTPFYMGTSATNDSLYQLTVSINYVEEKE